VQGGKLTEGTEHPGVKDGVGRVSIGRPRRVSSGRGPGGKGGAKSCAILQKKHLLRAGGKRSREEGGPTSAIVS